MTEPLATVVAICHNHARWVEGCLESIRRQTYTPCQVIVINNTTTDDSENLIRQFVANYALDWMVVQNDRPLSVVQNCNLGLNYTRGEFLAVLACDDEMLPDRLARQVAKFAQLPGEYACVYGEMNLIDEGGAPLGRFYAGKRLLAGQPLPSGTLLWENSHACFVGAPAALLRTASVRAVGGYDTRFNFEDWPLYLALGRAGKKFFGLPAPLTNYRLVAGSLGKQLGHQRLKEMHQLFSSNEDILVPHPRAVRKWQGFAARLRKSDTRRGWAFELRILRWAGLNYFAALLTNVSTSFSR